MTMITFGETICPLLSINKQSLILCNCKCAMLQTYNVSSGKTVSYCGLCKQPG